MKNLPFPQYMARQVAWMKDPRIFGALQRQLGRDPTHKDLEQYWEDRGRRAFNLRIAQRNPPASTPGELPAMASAA